MTTEWTTPGAQTVAPGVHRIPLPLPFDALRAVNVYALDTPDGPVLVDGGWAVAAARSALEAGLAALGHELGDVAAFLVTHIHRDHLGQALALRREFGTDVALGVDEQPSIELLQREPNAAARMERLARRCGDEGLAARFGEMLAEDDTSTPWAVPDRWLVHEDRIVVGDRTLTVLATPGHTAGHVSFVDDEAGLLLSGDHVLPHITPSIGFEPAPPDSPLGLFLSSLALLRERPDATLLPAHGAPGGSVHARVDELLVHHDERLRATLDAVAAGGTTAVEVARLLPWTRSARSFDDLDAFNRVLAANETLAHLRVLADRGAVAARVVGEVVEHGLA